MKTKIRLIGTSLLLIGMLVALFNVRPVSACIQAIYIRPDGSIHPSNTNLSTEDNMTYIFIGDINMPIVVQRSHIIIDGLGYALQGSGDGKGISLSGRTNVTIQTLDIEGFKFGIYLYSSSCNFIVGNNITANTYDGIRLSHACDNHVYRNNIVDNCRYGIKLVASTGNRIFHNSFIGNTHQADSICQSLNIWDDGYPKGGNYWDDHECNDLYRGVHQNIVGIDGICDLPYPINEKTKDNYPLMGPFSPHIMSGLNIPVFPDPEVGLIFDNVTTPGSTELTRTTIAPPLPEGFILVGPYYDIEVTAGFSGDVIIRIAYDDSGMTEEEEKNLCLMQTDIVLGDVNVDGKVNWKDLCIIWKAKGSYPGHPRWNPSCDLNNDEKVDRKDLRIAFRNYGKKSQWENITIFVDFEGNVAFGKTSDFSIQGVTRRS